MMVFKGWILYVFFSILIVNNLINFVIIFYRNMIYKDVNNIIKYVFYIDVVYFGLQFQVQGGKDQWVDIKLVMDIISFNMRVFNYRFR